MITLRFPELLQLFLAARNPRGYKKSGKSSHRIHIPDDLCITNRMPPSVGGSQGTVCRCPHLCKEKETCHPESQIN